VCARAVLAPHLVLPTAGAWPRRLLTHSSTFPPSPPAPRDPARPPLPLQPSATTESEPAAAAQLQLRVVAATAADDKEKRQKEGPAPSRSASRPGVLVLVVLAVLAALAIGLGVGLGAAPKKDAGGGSLAAAAPSASPTPTPSPTLPPQPSPTPRPYNVIELGFRNGTKGPAYNISGLVLRDIRCTIADASLLPAANVTFESWTNGSGHVFPLDPTDNINTDDCGATPLVRRRRLFHKSQLFLSCNDPETARVTLNMVNAVSGSADAEALWELTACVQIEMEKVFSDHMTSIMCCSEFADGPSGRPEYENYKIVRKAFRAIPGRCFSQAKLAYPTPSYARANLQHPLYGWQSVASSSSGSFIALVGKNEEIHISTDSGNTWSPKRSGLLQWTSVACSDDGRMLIAGVSGGQLWLSTNFGESWSATAVNRAWSGVAMDATGTRLVAVADKIYTAEASTLFITWVAASRPREPARWKSVAMSADGSRVAAVAWDNFIYISTDYGATFAPTTSASMRLWESVAMSSNGMVIAAVAYLQGLFISENGGSSFVRIGNLNCTNGLWEAVSVSHDGSVIAAACSLTGTFTREYPNPLWELRAADNTTRPGGDYLQGVAMNSDGSTLIVVGDSNNRTSAISVRTDAVWA
jgi:photosystem II stability/assembly factor-like uncharacterized protein